jgi:predicted polyphosphate/ATP-dependent NAD kinase
VLRLGLLINPLAGVGGPAALKGSDGMADAARERGSEPLAERRAQATLTELVDRRAQITLLTWAGAMGEHAARAAGFEPQVLGGAHAQNTTADDTVRAARALLRAGCDLLLFAGGDGTARDLVGALGTSRQPVLGIPAGVKMHSGVHAVNPGAAARVVAAMLDGAVVSFGAAEVRDIDEQGYREGRVHSRHYGELQVPAEPRWVQHTKIGGRESEPLVLEEIAAWIGERMGVSA